MGFSRQEYWSGLPFPSPGDLPDPGIEPRSPALQADALINTWLLTRNLQKVPKMSWGQILSLIYSHLPDLFIPTTLIYSYLHWSKHVGKSNGYFQWPWITKRNFRYHGVWWMAGMVGKISKFRGLRDSFYFSNLQMKCKFWSTGNLYKLTK